MHTMVRAKAILKAGLGAVLLAVGLGAAHAAGGFDLALTAATGEKASVSKFGLIAGWTRAEPLWQGQRWRLALRHEFELAAWRVPHARNLLEAGYSPVLRLERPLASAHSALFFEGSIGVRVLSHTHIGPSREMSTAFQFSDMLGLGWQWGADGRSTVGLRLQHLSNGGIKKPNSGMNFAQIYYRYRF